MRNSNSPSGIPFVLPADEIERMRAASGQTMEAFLSALVEPTRALARPPISNFRVGAVGMGSSGCVFRGVNLEFPGLPLHHAVHAEQFLIANMAQNGEASVRYLAVSAAPCGHCRQFLQELRGAPDIQVVIVDDKNAETQRLSKFLPHRFGPEDLLAQDFPLLLEPRNNCLAIIGDLASNKALNGCCSPLKQHAGFGSSNGSVLSHSLSHNLYAGSVGDEKQEQPARSYKNNLPRLRDAALDAANRSYAPYTKCPSGVAILTKSEEVFAGSYCESAAYNPSLLPLQAALVAFVANGGDGYEDVECAVLVEKEGAVVQQAASVRMVLDQISPGCPLYVYYAASPKQGILD